MSTPCDQDSSEPDVQGDHTPPAGSSKNTTAAVSSSDSSDLLAVLRDLASTVKRLEAHVAASNSASTLEDAVLEKSKGSVQTEENRTKGSIPRKFITSSCSMVCPDKWHPLVNNITLKELARVKARLLLPDMSQYDYDQLNTPLSVRAQKSIIREVESLGLTERYEFGPDKVSN